MATLQERVCNSCWCKTLRSRCPLLSCSTSNKGKKLRHLPLKWKELPAQTKDILINELRKFFLANADPKKEYIIVTYLHSTCPMNDLLTI